MSALRGFHPLLASMHVSLVPIFPLQTFLGFGPLLIKFSTNAWAHLSPSLLRNAVYHSPLENLGAAVDGEGAVHGAGPAEHGRLHRLRLVLVERLDAAAP